MNQISGLFRTHFLLVCIFFTPILITTARGISHSRFTKLAEVETYSTDRQRDIFKTFDSEDKKDKGIPIDPFDLMNRLNQAESMGNATTPSDALDEALNAFDESGY